MNRRVKIILLISATLLTFLTGCNSETASTGGIVKLHNDFPVGQIVPDIPFTSPEGKETTFDKVRQPVAIVAFVDVSSEKCCPAQSDLRNLADRFEYLPVTVTQVCLPTDDNSNKRKLAGDYDFNNLGMLTLYDAKGIAWRAFYKPQPNTVFLIDDNGRILSVSKKIGNLRHLVSRAQRLGEAEAQAVANLTEP